MSEATTYDWFKRLFIDNAKGALCRCSGGGGDGEVSDDMIATDDEVNDVLDEVFDSTDIIPEEDIATDDEVSDVLDEVFGN